MVALNALRTALAILRLRLLGRRTPLSVILSVTNRCNFSCRYCHVRVRRVRELGTEEMLRLVDEMAAAGTQRVGIQGGEPLMREDIGEIIGRCKRRGMFVTMGSNGSLLAEEGAIDRVRGVDALVLSLDGPAAHDLYRSKGSYKAVLDALVLARREGVRAWNTTVLTKASIGDIDAILELAERHGFSTYFTPLMRIGMETTGDTGALFALREEYLAAVDKLIEEKRRGRPIINSETYLRYLRGWPDFQRTVYIGESPEGLRRLPCFAGRLFCHVDCNGDVYPCINLVGRVEPVNAAERGFRDAFEALGPIPCESCSTFSFAELNILFSLRPEAVLNTLRLSLRR